MYTVIFKNCTEIIISNTFFLFKICMHTYWRYFFIFDSKFDSIIVKTITWIKVNLCNQASHSACVIEISAPGHNECTLVGFHVFCKNNKFSYFDYYINEYQIFINMLIIIFFTFESLMHFFTFKSLMQLLNKMRDIFNIVIVT